MRPPANCWGGAQSLRGPAPGLGCQGERAGPLCRHGAGRRAPELAVEQGVRGQRLLRAETALCPLQLPSRAPSRLAPCPITIATPSHDGRLLLPTRSHCFGDPSWSGVTCPLPPSPLPSAGKACEAGSCSQEPSTGTLESCADSVPLCPRRQPRPSRAEARGATVCPRECRRGRKNHTTEPSLRGRTGSRVESRLESLSVIGVACEAALMWQ